MLGLDTIVDANNEGTGGPVVDENSIDTNITDCLTHCHGSAALRCLIMEGNRDDTEAESCARAALQR